MKKVLLGAGMLVMLVCAGFESKAAGINIGSITVKINYERGIKEWNRDHTAVECVGKGICKISIDISFGLRAMLGTDEHGKLLILVPIETAEKYAGDFTNHGKYPVEALDLPPALVKNLGFPSGYKVAKGQYPVELDNSGKYYCIQIQ